MKRLFAILLVAVLATSFAYAHNEDATANAQFDVKVIAPLIVIEEEDITLPDIIKGQTRNWTPMVMTFSLVGENSYLIDVTATGPIAAVGNPAGDLVLLGAGWSTLPTALDASGNAAVTWTCGGADATASGTGTYNFTLTVTAQYHGL